MGIFKQYMSAVENGVESWEHYKIRHKFIIHYLFTLPLSCCIAYGWALNSAQWEQPYIASVITFLMMPLPYALSLMMGRGSVASSTYVAINIAFRFFTLLFIVFIWASLISEVLAWIFKPREEIKWF